MLVCNVCFKSYHHLGSHLWHGHKILSRDYKKEYNLDYKHALIDDETRKKEQQAFNLDRKKYLKNLFVNGDKYRFKKGKKYRIRFSEESMDRYLNQIKKVNKNRKPTICPICKVKYNNYTSHLYNKHGLVIAKIFRKTTLNKKK